SKIECFLIFILLNLSNKNCKKQITTLVIQNRCTQAEKNATTRSSTFYFARASQNKKSFHFPTATQNILILYTIF
ncbi:hypothetical protein, partial [Lutibacter oceani]